MAPFILGRNVTPTKGVNLPAESILASVYMRKKRVDRFAQANSWQQRLGELWLSYLDKVDPAGRAKVLKMENKFSSG